ncbi:MAG: dihydroorotate dehydrogenase electron transfer subunit [Clostridiales bacterium]|nr:dihydroorotate dehydrogenase electron transfer subunit [Clostridiales bacterium]
MKLLQARISEIKTINEEVFSMRLEFDNSFIFRPGQFIDIKVSEWDSPLLRRPISISRKISENEIELLIKIQGTGTKQMRKKMIGTEVDLIGPLGNGFYLDDLVKELPLLIVGGGIGIAPLKSLVNELKSRGYKNIDIVNGFRKEPYGKEGFDTFNYHEVDETKEGIFVTEFVENNLLNRPYQQVLACGPKPMLQILSKMFNEKNIPIQISMEEKMACGIGVCLGCAIKVKKDLFNYTYKKVCVDGPVFYGDEVIFDE